MTKHEPLDTAPESSELPKAPAMKWSRIATDLGPGLVFFVSYQWLQKNHPTDAILIATAIFLPFAIAAFVYGWVSERRIAPIPAMTTAMVLIFSALAFVFHDATFIKMRATFIFSFFGIALIGSSLLQHNLLKTVFEGSIRLPEPAWHTLAMRAGIFYISIAAINETLWRTQPEATWVWFHTWGDVLLSLIFWGSQMFFIAKHSPDFKNTKD